MMIMVWGYDLSERSGSKGQGFRRYGLDFRGHG
jgi:hypothetical protein